MARYRVTLDVKYRGEVTDVVEADDQFHAVTKAMTFLDINPHAVIKHSVENEVDQRAAIAELAEITDQINELILKGQRIADEADVEFEFTPPVGSANWYESGEWTSSDASCW